MSSRSCRSTADRKWLVSTCALVCAAVLSADSAAAPPGINGPANQTRVHNGLDANQVFTEVTWNCTNSGTGSDSNGATVVLSCGPFTHLVFPARRVDSRMTIRIVSTTGGGWGLLVANDQTNTSGGDNAANVAARSTARGNANLGLTVQFVDNDFSRLASGNYSITVTGTITGN